MIYSQVSQNSTLQYVKHPFRKFVLHLGYDQNKTVPLLESCKLDGQKKHMANIACTAKTSLLCCKALTGISFSHQHLSSTEQTLHLAPPIIMWQLMEETAAITLAISLLCAQLSTYCISMHLTSE